jgi:predicted porin
MGMDAAWDYGPYAVKAEYLRGSVSDVSCDWWYTMAGYKIPKLKVDFWLRYSQANYQQKTIRDIKASGAWDKDQWTPLVVYHLHPMADLYFEYYFNDTDSPSNAHKLKNNYGFVELIVKY